MTQRLCPECGVTCPADIDTCFRCGAVLGAAASLAPAGPAERSAGFVTPLAPVPAASAPPGGGGRAGWSVILAVVGVAALAVGVYFLFLRAGVPELPDQLVGVAAVEGPVDGVTEAETLVDSLGGASAKVYGTRERPEFIVLVGPEGESNELAARLRASVGATEGAVLTGDARLESEGIEYHCYGVTTSESFQALAPGLGFDCHWDEGGASYVVYFPGRGKAEAFELVPEIRSNLLVAP